MAHANAKLFQPTRVGNLNLSHRVVLAPLTRFRNDDAHVPTDMMVEHYAQRASVPGTLLISEATAVAPKAGGHENIPGIWSDAQVEAWKKALGRTAKPDFLAQPDCPQNPGGHYLYISSSDLPLSDRRDGVRPHAMTHGEILEHIEFWGTAAYNAVHRAGFDGVEVHGAYGYLVDQFTQDTCNERTDMWGVSIENRTRFALEIVKTIVAAVGEERTAIRLSPFNTNQDMHMEHPQPTLAYLASRIREAYPRFAYLHAVEPRVSGVTDRTVLKGESLEFLRAIWKGPKSEEQGSVFMVAGAYSPQDALEVSEETGDLVAFGRYYISNPDLPVRIKKNIPLTPYHWSTFYLIGSPRGLQ